MYNHSEIYFTNIPYCMLLAINYCNSTLKSKDLILTLHNIYYITNQKEAWGGAEKRIQSEKGGGGNRVRKFISLSRRIPYSIFSPIKSCLKKSAFIFKNHIVHKISTIKILQKLKKRQEKHGDSSFGN